MMRQYELVERVKAYEAGADEEILNRAYVFSMKAHGNQTRASGDPYFSHPVEVAGLLSDKKMDNASIIVGLLHDTVEDTPVTVEEIREKFGDEIAQLVDGVTKLSLLETQSQTDKAKQAENFRKLVLAMSEDIRVLIVKLADRLHNMRTLHFIKKEEKRRRIARETMDIYVPLAERIGIRDWKEELEDISFTQLNPDARSSLTKRLTFLESQGEDLIARVKTELGALLSKHDISSEISGRKKTPYSIWRKMQRQNIGFEQLSDIMAFRVIVDDVGDCYSALGVIHAEYPVVPGRFKDYISLAKPNGYSSLHTGVIGPGNQRIEVQIRTRHMHDVAELGLAAHWQYKAGGSETKNTEGKQYRWMRDMLDILANAAGPEEFLEHTKMEMFADQVFAFSPKGDLIALPQGATAVDFAYAVHSEIGNTCVGAKINGRIAPLRTRLRNGDQVFISTSKAQKPSPAWESFVVTGKARAAIRRFMRAQRREQYVNLGREMLEKHFRQSNYDCTEKGLKIVLPKLKIDSLDDLYVHVGEGLVTAREVLHMVFPASKDDSTRKTLPLASPRTNMSAHSVPIKGLIPGMAVHYAKCCHPVPGDRIVGIVSSGKGVNIHTIDCHNLENFTDMPERWLDVSWDAEQGAGQSYVGRIYVVVVNEPGSLGTLTSAIGRDGGNISNLQFVVRGQDFFEMRIDLEVADVRQLTNIIAGLRATSVVHSVERAQN